MATTDTTFDTLTAWRVACFEELGFDKLEAECLAEVKLPSVVITKGKRQVYEAPLHHVKVGKMLEDGCTKQQVLDIFL